MNPMHLHLMLDHVPVLGLLAGIALVQAGVFRRSAEFERAGLWAYSLAAAAALAAALAGYRAAPIAVNLGAPEAFVALHREAAVVATAFLAALGAAAAWGLFRFKGQAPSQRLLTGTTVLAVGCALMLVKVAWLGGQIRHPETQGDWIDYR